MPEIKVRGVVATNRAADMCGYKTTYSMAALESLVAQLPGKSVNLNFNPGQPVGVVRSAKLNRGKGEVIAEMNVDHDLLGRGFHSAISYVCERDHWFDVDGGEPLRVISELLVMDPALTLTSTDPGTTEIRPKFLRDRIVLWLKNFKERR